MHAHDYRNPPNVVAAEPGWQVVSLEHVTDEELATTHPLSLKLRLSPVVAWRIDFHQRPVEDLLLEHGAGSWTGGYQVSAVCLDGVCAGSIGEEILRSPSGQYLIIAYVEFEDELTARAELIRRAALRREYAREALKA